MSSRSTRCRMRSRSSSQAAAGKFEVPNWDQASQKKVRDALLVLATTMPDFSKAFGTKDRGRSDPPSDRNRRRLGRQPRQGRDLSQHHAAEQRRHDDLQAHRQGRAGRRRSGPSVSTMPKGYYEKNPYNAYSINSITGEEKRRRLDRDPVRRLRRQDSELPADHEGLELHGAALSAARRNSERQMEIPGAATSELRGRP